MCKWIVQKKGVTNLTASHPPPMPLQWLGGALGHLGGTHAWPHGNWIARYQDFFNFLAHLVVVGLGGCGVVAGPNS